MKIVILLVVIILAAIMLKIAGGNPGIVFWGASICFMFLSNNAILSRDWYVSYAIPFATISVILTLLTFVFLAPVVIWTILFALLAASVVVLVIFILGSRLFNVVYWGANSVFYLLMLYGMYFFAYA